jgi:thymidylate kinase
VRSTRLILVEGLPGSGKSTMGQFIESQLADHCIPVTWWYEEQKNHPLYVFNDGPSIRQVVDDIFSGRHQTVIEAALHRWRAFAARVQESDGIVILDSCLYGYLTWTLFPADVSTSVIAAYVDEVEAILRPLNPSLIYFYQADVALALTRVGLARGGEWSDDMVRRHTSTPYAKRGRLVGVAGYHDFWRSYQALSNELFERSALDRIKVEASAGEWGRYRSEVMEFLELSVADRPRPGNDDTLDCVGTYTQRSNDGTTMTVDISKQDGDLFASGLPHLWPRNRLVPVSTDTYQVVSFPCEIRFERDASGRICRLVARGPELLSGPLDLALTRSGDPHR